ncbi:M48 family metalloprotease [Halosimplex litoreum]|uniref:M48 family metalloprotease n=1 Tax=Halosimplex litoreum TaxID=1198301 RepID=A0A7U3WBE2_9EURY|nr:M56 family metallopeptidase [Halosimplex litoreum]QPV64937.1 M48 family metalloprotease [Halosimplex litoreum]
MRRRTALGLAARAVAALCIQSTLAVAVGAVVVCWLAVGVAVASLVVPGMGFRADAPWLIAVAGVMVLAGLATEVERRFDRRREALLPEPAPDDDTAGALAEQVSRLAHQAGVAPPAVRTADRIDPRCYTVESDETPVIVVSAGLLDALDERERRAVVAHEVAHLANRDHRVMRWVLTPVVAAAQVSEGEPASHDPVARAVDRAGDSLLLWGAVGVGVFSRGREFAADAAAARLTGDPAALAAALRTLDDELADPPDRDRRERAVATDALSIPPLDRSRRGPTATHPDTAARIERLERLVERAETA